MNMSPLCCQLVTFASLVFSDKDRILLTPQIENIIFFVNIQHLCKARFLLSFCITACEKGRENPLFPISLLSYLHLRRLSSSSAEGQAEGFRPSRSCWRTDCHSPIPHVSSFIKWRFIKVLPFAQMMPQRCGNLNQSHTSCYISTTSETLLVSCSTSRSECIEENNRHAMEI